MVEQADAVVTEEEVNEVPVIREEVKVAMGNLLMRIHGGEPMADIMGIEDETMDICESQAYRLYLARQYDKAKVMARGVLALNKKRALSQMIMGDVALSEYCFREAVEHLQQAYELAPEEMGIRARLGESLLKHGKKEAAVGHLEAVVKAEEVEPSIVQRCKALLETCS